MISDSGEYLRIKVLFERFMASLPPMDEQLKPTEEPSPEFLETCKQLERETISNTGYLLNHINRLMVENERLSQANAEAQASPDILDFSYARDGVDIHFDIENTMQTFRAATFSPKNLEVDRVNRTTNVVVTMPLTKAERIHYELGRRIEKAKAEISPAAE